MTHLRWHKLWKRKKDPGFANERSDTEKVVAARSPHHSKTRTAGNHTAKPNGGRRRKRAVADSPSAKDLLAQLKAQKARMNGGKKPKKDGATTAFDTVSLGLDGRAGAKATGKPKPKRGKAAPSRATKPQTRGSQKEREQRRANERKAKFARLRREKEARIAARSEAKASKAVNVVKAQSDARDVVPLNVEIRARSASQVTLAWETDPQVTSWKAACLLSDGTEFMKTRVAGALDAVALGGLNRAPHPVRFRVRGHDQVGKLVCDGFVEDVRAT